MTRIGFRYKGKDYWYGFIDIDKVEIKFHITEEQKNLYEKGIVSESTDGNFVPITLKKAFPRLDYAEKGRTLFMQWINKEIEFEYMMVVYDDETYRVTSAFQLYNLVPEKVAEYVDCAGGVKLDIYVIQIKYNGFQRYKIEDGVVDWTAPLCAYTNR